MPLAMSLAAFKASTQCVASRYVIVYNSKERSAHLTMKPNVCSEECLLAAGRGSCSAPKMSKKRIGCETFLRSSECE